MAIQHAAPEAVSAWLMTLISIWSFVTPSLLFLSLSLSARAGCFPWAQVQTLQFWGTMCLSFGLLLPNSEHMWSKYAANSSNTNMLLSIQSGAARAHSFSLSASLSLSRLVVCLTHTHTLIHTHTFTYATHTATCKSQTYLSLSWTERKHL